MLMLMALHGEPASLPGTSRCGSKCARPNSTSASRGAIFSTVVTTCTAPALRTPAMFTNVATQIAASAVKAPNNGLAPTAGTKVER